MAVSQAGSTRPPRRPCSTSLTTPSTPGGRCGKVAHQVLPEQEALTAGLRQAEDRLAVTLADADGFQSEVRGAERAHELATIELGAAKERLIESGATCSPCASIFTLSSLQPS